MSNEITFDEIKVGDSIKTREVFNDGTVLEQEFTVENRSPNYAGNDFALVHLKLSSRTELTITRVQMPEPKKIGTVIEYMWYGDLETAVLFTLLDDVKYPWIRPSGHTLMWDDILTSDPNPEIKED